MAGWVLAGCGALGIVLGALALTVATRQLRLLDLHVSTVQEWFTEYRLAGWREQAGRVCAWPVSERETFEKVITRGVVGAAVRNASQMPVYRLEIVYRDPPAAWTAVRRVGIVPPSETPEVYAGFDEEQTDGTPDPERINADGTIRLAPSAQMHIELRFTDSRGRRWVRADDGTLAEAPTLAAGE